MKDLQNIFKECKKQLDEIGIEYGNVKEVTINTRAKNRFGQCRVIKNSDRWEDKVYAININEALLRDNVPNIIIYDTLIHELLHSCKDCMNHGAKWKKMANWVNSNYSYYHIQRCGTEEENKYLDSNTKEKFKYIIKCKKCGYEYHRMRYCDSVKHPEDYTCSECGGELKRIK